MTATTRFEGTGPVARYWLANCEGFAVRGRPNGVVEQLIRGDDNPHATAWLVVRTRGRRRRTIPAHAVDAVDPAARTLILTPRRRLAAVAPPLRLVSGRTAAAAGTAGRRAAGVSVQASRLAVERATPTISRLRTAAAIAARAAAASIVRLAAEALGAATPGRGARALAGSFVRLGAEARASGALLRRYPKPYVPANFWASRRTRRAAGSPTTFR